MSLVYKCPAWPPGHRKCQSSANAQVKKESPSFVDSLRCASRHTKPFTCRLLLPLRASPRSGYDYPTSPTKLSHRACPWSQGPWASLLGLKPRSDPAGAQLLQSRVKVLVLLGPRSGPGTKQSWRDGVSCSVLPHSPSPDLSFPLWKAPELDTGLPRVLPHGPLLPRRTFPVPPPSQLTTLWPGVLPIVTNSHSQKKRPWRSLDTHFLSWDTSTSVVSLLAS